MKTRTFPPVFKEGSTCAARYSRIRGYSVLSPC